MLFAKYYGLIYVKVDPRLINLTHNLKHSDHIHRFGRLFQNVTCKGEFPLRVSHSLTLHTYMSTPKQLFH